MYLVFRPVQINESCISIIFNILFYCYIKAQGYSLMLVLTIQTFEAAKLHYLISYCKVHSIYGQSNAVLHAKKKSIFLFCVICCHIGKKATTILSNSACWRSVSPWNMGTGPVSLCSNNLRQSDTKMVPNNFCLIVFKPICNTATILPPWVRAKT